MGESTPATPTPDIQLFRDVFNASPVGIAVEDFDGQPLFVNPAFCSFLGFSEEELRSKHCVDFSPPEDAQKDWVLFQQLRAGSIGRQYPWRPTDLQTDLNDQIWANVVQRLVD